MVRLIIKKTMFQQFWILISFHKGVRKNMQCNFFYYLAAVMLIKK